MDFDSLVADITTDQVKAYIVGLIQAAGIPVTNWYPGSTADQLVVIIAQVIFNYCGVSKQAIRGMFLDLAYDPGDIDGQPPAPGWLSALGESDYGTPRDEATFATGFVTITNSSGTTHTFGPFDLFLQSSVSGKTYQNDVDPSIYTNPDGTVTIVPGQVITIPVVAQEIGTPSNANPGDVSILTTPLSGPSGNATVTNANPILGTDREDRDHYIARCKFAASATSPNGPADKYTYIGTSAREDGTFGSMPSTSPPLNITRIQVTRNSATGRVDVWYGSPSGAADPGDFAIVDALITQYAVPDCVTYLGHLAIQDTVNVTYTAEGTATPGLTSSIVQTEIATALSNFFSVIPIGGYANNGTQGTLFVSKIESVIGSADKAVFSVTVSVPASDQTVLNGHVPVLGTVSGSVTLL